MKPYSTFSKQREPISLSSHNYIISKPKSKTEKNMTSTSSLSSKESTLSTLETLSPPIQKLKEKLEKFVIEKCQPAERIYEQHLQNRIGKQRWTIDAIPPCIEELKNEAKMLGLWNLFLPHPLPTFLIQNESCLEPSIYLSTREYGILCEVMGKSFLAPEACNCNAPDTGNMEVLLKHGSIEQQQTYLPSLLNGESRSAFLMTEPDVASSDATNIQTSLTKVITKENDHQGGGNPRIKYILNGRKWWSTGGMDPRCKMALVLARMDYSHPSVLQQQQQHKQKQHQNRKLNIATSNPNHGAHTVVIVPMEKVTMIRPLTVFGCDDAPHGHAEVLLDNIVLDESCLVLGEGRGFEIAQSRLGPGRIHHCMRAVGLAVRCYDLMLERSLSRKTFGKYLCEHG